MIVYSAENIECICYSKGNIQEFDGNGHVYIAFSFFFTHFICFLISKLGSLFTFFSPELLKTGKLNEF